MHVNIHGQQKYIAVSTVTLQKVADGVTYPYHCNNCGNTLCVIGGKVTKIYPILEPSEQIVVIQTCKSCKAKYTFQDSNTPTHTNMIKVLLSPKMEMQNFYCYLGGGENKYLNKILEYSKGSLYSPMLHKTYKAPFVATCGNKDCELQYQFTQLS